MSEDGWSLGEEGVVRAKLLDAVPGLAHGFSARRAGADGPTDFGGADASGEPFRSARQSFVEACGLGARQPQLLRQVHGDRVLEGDAEPVPPADGWFATRDRDVARVLGIRVADCVPVLIADRAGRAVAAVHSGWRGSAAGIAVRAVERFEGAGLPASGLVAALGPAISAEHYEVGDEVLQGLGEGPWARRRGDRWHVDLRLAIAAQLGRAGVRRESITVAPWCTFRDADAFFSYRRQGAETGRMIACIGWSP